MMTTNPQTNTEMPRHSQFNGVDLISHHPSKLRRMYDLLDQMENEAHHINNGPGSQLIDLIVHLRKQMISLFPDDHHALSTHHDAYTRPGMDSSRYWDFP